MVQAGTENFSMMILMKRMNKKKIQKLFALIKDIREARDRLMNVSDPALKPETDGKNKKRKLGEKKHRSLLVICLAYIRTETEKLKDLIPAAAVSSSLVDSSQTKGSCEE
ncbi:hypothetical protein SADUNF_Sadunf06G0182600 [Salix dunnii]|uniref:Uncharacterized protein n=1 Tax=Salix dunnii TaxID=1413687 RepID=A0A835K2B9_9ROSI|nr:hypothetical protein SADUNF_Sadunf06G0182600 [Salix dunnii]